MWQEEKIKTAGLETSGPLEEEPAGDRRSDKKDSRQDASGPIRGKPWNATILVASPRVQQEEKIKTAGLETSVPLEEEPAGCQRSDKRKAMGRHHPGGIAPRVAEEKIKTAGRMPAIH